jgi:FKBP-type peptidyl-prolyl cis-trans isomerase
MKSIQFVFLIFFLLCLSCKRNVQEIPTDHSIVRKKEKEKLEKINNYVVKRNEELISQFVKRNGLEMTKTGSGLWFGIYEKGKGKQVTKDCSVYFYYTLRLLDGSLIDSVSVQAPRSFRVGRGGVESGLEEGILYMHEGDKAILIIPPHLAFGNFGDQGKIPPGAILFYDIHLIKISM